MPPRPSGTVVGIPQVMGSVPDAATRQLNNAGALPFFSIAPGCFTKLPVAQGSDHDSHEHFQA